MVDVNERSASITVNGEEYELILTTKATKELQQDTEGSKI